MANDMNIDTYQQIKKEQVAEARNLGYRVHHVFEEEDTYITRDEWYAATSEWVEDYHRSGGMWSYLL